MCRQQGLISLYSPHSTHKLQPLDVSVFSPLANYYSQILNDWLFRAQRLSKISKRDFFGLFWPSFQAVFTPETIKSGWKKTGLQPFDPEVVISQVRTDDTSDSGHSSSSAMLNPEWRTMRTLMRSITGREDTTKTRKLENTIEKVTTELAFLRAENAGLRKTVRVEKGRRRRGKPLFDDLGVDSETKGVFFSPSKIKRARERQKERTEEEQRAAAQKAEEKQERELRKLEEQRLVAERKAEREKKKIEREEEVERKKGLRAEVLEQQRLRREAKAKSKKLDKGQNKKPEESGSQQSDSFIAIEEVERRAAQITTTRSGRQLKASRQFDD